MKITLMIIYIIIGTCLASKTNQNITENDETSSNYEIEDLNKSDDDEFESLDVQKKRESGYLYSKPTRLPLNYRPSQSARLKQRRRPHSKRPSQQIRPFSHYSVPTKNLPVVQKGFLPSSPNVLKNLHSEEENPIASQNDIPFGRNTALYLPPVNQKLPAFSPPSSFSLRNRLNLIQDNSNGQQISDAALFLAQNSQAISELYSAQAPNQVYAPSNEDLFDQNNQIQQQNNAENVGNSHSNSPAQVSQDFAGPFPGYASGILSREETLQKIQSLEKDRLIFELQQALLQSQSSQSREIAQNTNIYSQNHKLQTPYGTIESPKFNFNYGIPSSSPGAMPSPTQPSPSDGTNLAGTPPQPGTTPDSSLYPNYFPNLIAGTNIFSNFPNYNPGFIGFGSQNIPIKPTDAPTHFGIPLPSRPDQKPSVLPDSTGITPVIPARPTAPSIPVSPIHPISPPIQPIRPFYPITPSLRPVVPVNPVTSIQPVVTPVVPHQGHAFGIQPQHPLVYKHVKSVYPYYYPEQKVISPAQSWIYPQKRIWH